MEAVQAGRLPLSGGRGEHRDVSSRPGCSFAWPGTSPPPAAAPAVAQAAHVSRLLSWSNSSLSSILLRQHSPGWSLGCRVGCTLHSSGADVCHAAAAGTHTLPPLVVPHTSWTTSHPKCLPRTKFRSVEVHDAERARHSRPGPFQGISSAEETARAWPCEPFSSEWRTSRLNALNQANPALCPPPHTLSHSPPDSRFFPQPNLVSSSKTIAPGRGQHGWPCDQDDP